MTAVTAAALVWLLLLAHPAAAQQWETYLAEDFLGEQVIFPQGEFGEASYTVDNAGRYIINGMDSGVDSLAALTDSAYYYRVEADCQVLSSTAGELAFCGLIFHYKRRPGDEKPSYYVFYVYGDGFYGVKRMLSTRTEVLLPLTRTDLLDASRPNRLAVEARGSNFDLFINGQRVDGFSDVQLDGGGFGFYISKHTIGAFDNFRVSVEPRPAQQAAARQPTAAESGGRDEPGPRAGYRMPRIPKDPNRPLYPWEVGYDKNVNRKKREQEAQARGETPPARSRTDQALTRDTTSRSTPPSLRQQEGGRQAPAAQSSPQRQSPPPRESSRPPAAPPPAAREPVEPRQPPRRLNDPPRTLDEPAEVQDEPVEVQDEPVAEDLLYRPVGSVRDADPTPMDVEQIELPEDEPVPGPSPLPGGGSPRPQEPIPLRPGAVDSNVLPEERELRDEPLREPRVIPETPAVPPETTPDPEVVEEPRREPRRRGLAVGSDDWDAAPPARYDPERRFPEEERERRAEEEARRRAEEEREERLAAEEQDRRQAEIDARREAGRDARPVSAPPPVEDDGPRLEVESLDIEEAQYMDEEPESLPLRPVASLPREPEPDPATEVDFSLPDTFDLSPPADEPQAPAEFEVPPLTDLPLSGLDRVSDDFTDRSIWMEQETATSRYFYHDNDYRIDNLRAETMAISFQQDSFVDANIQLDAEHIGGLDYVGYGLAGRFNYVGTSVSYYGMFVSRTGEFMLLKVINGRESVLHDWTETSLLNTGTTNRIGLRFEGDRIVALINGQVAATVSDGDIPSGGYALLAGPGVAARFDNLQLTGNRQ